MTLPRERIRALHAARHFLIVLLDPKATPRVPREIRRHASRVLRHYPWESEVEQLATSGLWQFDSDAHDRRLQAAVEKVTKVKTVRGKKT